MRNTIISLAVFMIITSIAQAKKVERTVEHELTRDGSHVKVEIKVDSPIATITDIHSSGERTIFNHQNK